MSVPNNTLLSIPNYSFMSVPIFINVYTYGKITVYT